MDYEAQADRIINDPPTPRKFAKLDPSMTKNRGLSPFAGMGADVQVHARRKADGADLVFGRSKLDAIMLAQKLLDDDRYSNVQILTDRTDGTKTMKIPQKRR